MGMLCAVVFNRSGQLYYYDPDGHDVAVGDYVLVPVGDQPEMAEVVWAAEWVGDDTSGFAKVVGKATEADAKRSAVVRRLKARARVAARRLVRDHDLPMKVVGVEVALSSDGESAAATTIYFSAPHRVDFRALVRDLGATLGCRIDLRQVSARDELKLQGSIGSCGRDTCCSTFLKDFEPVTLRMVRDQDLPMNPMRISGACGRLMCCLKYEHPLYQDFRRRAPGQGACVETEQGSGRVVGHSVPEDAVVVRLDADGARVVCPVSDVCSARQAYNTRPKR
ncbi:regulatory iron-sulfur-containing complex subunit RicT [Blastococcus sp. Marseille-P5729]|uniref:PSP1 domain-containing protein n=1 Tax=Blastococcus sp. Marseille-P5729 TaxID=2086582 RepID=UPI000D0ED4CC|nr:regulatory iron-sulfur-containing complex subunit RicT [Blastococcus sp. Marseille-P5729]